MPRSRAVELRPSRMRRGAAAEPPRSSSPEPGPRGASRRDRTGALVLRGYPGSPFARPVSVFGPQPAVTIAAITAMTAPVITGSNQPAKTIVLMLLVV